MKMIPIRIVYSAPISEIWNDVITFAQKVAELESIDIVEIETGESDEECAFASVHEKKIYLFSTSRAVVLHELAHIETNQGHTYDWIVCFAYLCKKYLTEQEYLGEMYKAEKRYKSAHGLVQFLASRDSLDEKTRWAWGKTK